MAIDLGGNNSTPTLNDFNDADSGTNGLQNFPVLKTATTINRHTTITGKLNSNSEYYYRIEFFTNSIRNSGSRQDMVKREHTWALRLRPRWKWKRDIQCSIEWVSLAAGSTVTATATVDLGSTYGSTSEFWRQHRRERGEPD